MTTFADRHRSSGNSTSGGNNGTDTSSDPTAVADASIDLALDATATASSSASGQGASAAIDGVVDGYPSNYSAEWASQGQGIDAYLMLTWPSVVTFDSVVLHDRPNDNDRVWSSTLTFDDGTVVNVDTLPNDGTGLVVNFTAVQTSTLRFDVTDVSATTSNVGLAEIEVYYTG